MTEFSRTYRAPIEPIHLAACHGLAQSVKSYLQQDTEDMATGLSQNFFGKFLRLRRQNNATFPTSRWHQLKMLSVLVLFVCDTVDLDGQPLALTYILEFCPTVDDWHIWCAVTSGLPPLLRLLLQNRKSDITLLKPICANPNIYEELGIGICSDVVFGPYAALQYIEFCITNNGNPVIDLFLEKDIKSTSNADLWGGPFIMRSSIWSAGS